MTFLPAPRLRRAPSRLLRGLYIVVWTVGLLWLLGLLLFVSEIKNLTEPPSYDALEPTDGIVALTGGSERIATALDILRAGKGKKLFVSGVHPGLTLDRLLANQPVTAELRSCCIILGHAAGSTQGNAEETKIWLAAEGFHSLRLVTGNYHMPRSLLIFHEAMPDIEIIPYPVSPDSVRLKYWWARPGTASLLINEYDKYLWANLRPYFIKLVTME